MDNEMASLLLSRQGTGKLKLVCETLLERAVQKTNTFLECEYCHYCVDALDHTVDDVEHAADCPVFAAREVLALIRWAESKTKQFKK
jgi:hypothetical protein